MNTPAYRATKIFYMERIEDHVDFAKNRFATLEEPFAVVNPVDPGADDRAVRLGDPVTIVINKAYLPISLTDLENSRVSDLVGFRDSRDIAVLLDVGLKPGSDEEFIAAWYQRDVPADAVLEFQDIPVYSQDSWNSDVPPYFRVRLVDVSAERNARTAEFLKLAGQVGSSVASLAGSPAAGVGVSVAQKAAELVLSNDQNRILVDYTFNLFSISHIREAGGVPLGLFRKGGVVVMGRPFEVDNMFWEKQFQYDNQLRRVQERSTDGAGKAIPAPFLVATVITAESIIPNVVKRRSRIVTEILTNAAVVVQEDLQGVIEDIDKLSASLNVLKARQDFRKFPTLDTLQSVITEWGDNAAQLPEAERDFLRATLRTVTGQTFADPSGYQRWYEACKNSMVIDVSSRKVLGRDGNTLPVNCGAP